MRICVCGSPTLPALRRSPGVVGGCVSAARAAPPPVVRTTAATTTAVHAAMASRREPMIDSLPRSDDPFGADAFPARERRANGNSPDGGDGAAGGPFRPLGVRSGTAGGAPGRPGGSGPAAVRRARGLRARDEARGDQVPLAAVPVGGGGRGGGGGGGGGHRDAPVGRSSVQ